MQGGALYRTDEGARTMFVFVGTRDTRLLLPSRQSSSSLGCGSDYLLTKIPTQSFCILDLNLYHHHVARRASNIFASITESQCLPVCGTMSTTGLLVGKDIWHQAQCIAKHSKQTVYNPFSYSAF